MYRLRDRGDLAEYQRGDGLLEMEPGGLPTLREHLATVLKPRGQDQQGQGSIAERRATVETALAAERHRKLRIENNLREGQLIEVSKLEPIIFNMIASARDAFIRLAKPASMEAVGLGLPTGQQFALERALDEMIDQALEQFSLAPITPPTRDS